MPELKNTNHGLLFEPIVIDKDWVFGSNLQAGGTPLEPTGQWLKYLPQDEFQAWNGYETSACASFGTLNAIEILIRRLFNRTENYSDRFLAKVSGTTALGNTPQKVAETVRKVGLVGQNNWPYDASIDTFQKFYADIPRQFYALASLWFAEFEFKHEYVPTNPTSLKDALKYSPLGISVNLWYLNDGIWSKPPNTGDNHWVCLVGYEEGKYWLIFDSYDASLKRVAWDNQFQVAKRYSISSLTENMSTWGAVKKAITKWINDTLGFLGV